MATLDIEGQKVQVDDSFLQLPPDQQNATVDEIASSLKAKPSGGSSLGGAAKSLGTGLAEGVIGLAGIPGDLAALNMKMAGRNASPGMGSADIQKRIEQYTGEFYKPQGTIEETFNKIGQFAPAVIGGPETLAARVATRAVAPAIASEIGGKVAGPYGEVAGALVGAGTATAAARKFQEMAAARTAANAATPSTENLLKTAGSQFDQARDMNVVVKPDFATNAANDMRQAIKGFDPEAHKPLFAAADRLENLAPKTPTYYHGTNRQFDNFDAAKLQSGSGSADAAHGFYFTNDPEIASFFADSAKQGRVIRTNLDIKNPKTIDLAEFRKSDFEELKDSAAGINRKNDAVKQAFADGHDAVIFKNSSEGKGPVSTTTVVKNTSQIRQLGAHENGVPMNDVENIRKQLVSLKTSPDASIREGARQAIKSLQKSQMALTPAETLAGDAGAFSALTKDAVGNWAAGKRSNTVMGKAALGELNAATAGSGANQDNALRQAFKQLARPVNNDITPKWQRLGFNKEEGAAIEKAARGTLGGNAARYLGKLAPTGSVSGVLSGGAGFAAAGPLGAIGLPAAGYLAKKIGDLSTKRAVSAVDSLVRSRSPLAAQVAAQLPPQIVKQLPAKTSRLLQALILADPVLSKQVSQPVGQPAPY